MSFHWWIVSNLIGGRDSLCCLFSFCVVGTVHPTDQFLSTHFVPNFQIGNKSDCWINYVFDAYAPTTDSRDCVTDFSGIDVSNEPRARGFYPNRFSYQR